MSTFSMQTGVIHDFTAAESTGWLTVSFDTPFSSQPNVFAQCQTRNGMDTPGTRIQNVSSHSFEVRMDEVIMNDAQSSKLGAMGKLSGSGTHPNGETLAWMAVAM